MKKLLSLIMLGFAFIPFISQGSPKNTNNFEPSVTQQFISKAKANDNWKKAFITGKHAQIVFMNVSPMTNPKNEIGMETHPFDQIILIASGSGKAILSGKTITVKSGDMIFIPKGTQHNVVNSNVKESLKIISIYSDTDIPANSFFKRNTDEQNS